MKRNNNKIQSNQSRPNYSFAIASPFVLHLGSQTSSPSWALLQPARWALPGSPAPACSRQQQAGAGLNMRTYATSNYILLARKKCIELKIRLQPHATSRLYLRCYIGMHGFQTQMFHNLIFDTYMALFDASDTIHIQLETPKEKQLPYSISVIFVPIGSAFISNYIQD